MAEMDKETMDIAEEETVSEEETASEEVKEQDIQEPAEEQDVEESKSRVDKKAAKKQAKQDKKEEAYKEKIDQLEDKVKRQLAEFENFRNRTEREKQSMYETGAKSVIEKILPVIDNFERGFATVEQEDNEDAFVGVMGMVYKQMLDELEKIGVKSIEAVGCEFEPNFHSEVMQVESEEYESGVVSQELLKGYTYHDVVGRHIMVAVVS